MATQERRSPKAATYDQAALKAAIETLEDRPRIPEKTPASSSADGYQGEICRDANYLYLFQDGTWKRASLSSF